jgi:flavin reductase (DIM6/NTAB) family NADH-FMN oxidoreductase RutF
MSDSSSSKVVAASAALGIGTGILAANLWFHRKVNNTVTSLLASRPKYQPGQTLYPPSDDFGKKVHIFDPSKLASSYNLIISTATPRPIALISSRNPTTKVDNVSPFSYFGAVAHDPPMFAIGFCRNKGEQKDSLVNILASKEFAVNIISEWYLDAANHSCGHFKPEVDEFVESGMTKGDCDAIDAPRVKEAAVTYECRLEHVHSIENNGKSTTEVVLAKVVRVHVDEEVLAENHNPMKPVVNTMKLKPVGRIGGNIYTILGETVDIPRPKVS